MELIYDPYMLPFGLCVLAFIVAAWLLALIDSVRNA